MSHSLQLVEVSADASSGVNFIDNCKFHPVLPLCSPRALRSCSSTLIPLDMRSGLYPRPLPYTVGQDAVGTLVHVPSTTSSSTALPKPKVGEKVWTPANSSFAEYMVAPWWKVVGIPSGVDEKDGVGMATIGLTAMTLVKESYAVKQGDWVLVRAAAGGVGLVLCQVGLMVSGMLLQLMSCRSVDTSAPT